MKGIPLIIAILFIGMTVSLIVAYYYREEYRYNSMVQTIKETAEVATTNQLDRSNRVEIGENTVDKGEFEALFKELFAKNISTKLEITNYEFEYLDGSNEFMKALYIAVTDDRGNTYRTLVGTDINNE